MTLAAMSTVAPVPYRQPPVDAWIPWPSLASTAVTDSSRTAPSVASNAPPFAVPTRGKMFACRTASDAPAVTANLTASS
jgi:hypothetical protein